MWKFTLESFDKKKKKKIYSIKIILHFCICSAVSITIIWI